jgi:glyoxylase I family protein
MKTPPSTHRGLLHHVIVTVSSLERSMPFYRAVLGDLGYECNGSNYGDGHRYEDWKRWDHDSPHEFGIAEAWAEHRAVRHEMGAVGHHHHLAFCALDRADVDRFYEKVLVPLAQAGHCTIDDPPCDCPEHAEGYYATFFRDPDGLKYEFVLNPNHLRKKQARESS